MTKVLFVCLGNICRSPMAEAIFLNKIYKRGLQDDFSTDSAGTGAYHIGKQPDTRTLEVLDAHGISHKHAAKQVISEDSLIYDYFIAMDQYNLSDLKQLLDGNCTIKLIREFDTENGNVNVPDPYLGSIHDFEAVFQILNRSMDHFVQYLIEQSK